MDSIELTRQINIALERIRNKNTISPKELVQKLRKALPGVEFKEPKNQRQRSKRLKLIKEVWKLQKHR